VASFINQYFEPVWQSVRPVPLVHVDFGNGSVLTRTLNGNVATYVCSADGQVLDVLAGIYTPTVYVERLGQFRLLANYVDQQGKVNREARLRDYHKGQAEALAKREIPAKLVNVAPISKATIEGGLKAMLVAGGAVPTTPASGPAEREIDTPRVGSAEDLARWKLLAEDTRLNESIRRLQVHQKLLETGLVRPDNVVKWLYREVLHADLDDPYLGLGATLFANYPFADRNVH
jgi:hypothetical protein